MRRLVLLASLAVVVAACGGDDEAPAADASAPPSTRLLGMNDVTMLVPLPADPAQPVLEKLTFGDDRMVDGAQFIAFVIAADMAPKTGDQLSMDDYHVVAVRFDLCDRTTAPCAPDADGRLRLVLQAAYVKDGEPRAQDIGVHLFFRIPNADLPDVVQELRRLAELQDAPVEAALQVNPALAAGNTAYADRLRALVDRYARFANMTRMTALGQIRDAGGFEWVAREMDRHGNDLVLEPIPELGMLMTKQKIQAESGDVVYDVTPLAPTAAEPALIGAMWQRTPRDQQVAALDELAAIQNPDLHSNANTQCMGCHLATYLTAYRANEIGVAQSTLPSAFTRSFRDTSVGGLVYQDQRVVRGLGWGGAFPIISQRAANETANVADEIEKRFPIP